MLPSIDYALMIAADASDVMITLMLRADARAMSAMAFTLRRVCCCCAITTRCRVARTVAHEYAARFTRLRYSAATCQLKSRGCRRHYGHAPSV